MGHTKVYSLNLEKLGIVEEIKKPNYPVQTPPRRTSAMYAPVTEELTYEPTHNHHEVPSAHTDVLPPSQADTTTYTRYVPDYTEDTEKIRRMELADFQAMMRRHRGVSGPIVTKRYREIMKEVTV